MSEVVVYALCNSYWRSIKAGNRTYDAVKEKYKPGVKQLAKQDVIDEEITAEEYEAYIGEAYVAAEAE